MTDDRKPFALSRGPTSFRLSDLDQAKTTIRDKDNAAHTLPPPKHTRIDHPRLAPPGMSGIKTAQRLGLPVHPPKQERPPGPRQPGEVAETFKPLAPPTPGKSHDRGR